MEKRAYCMLHFHPPKFYRTSVLGNSEMAEMNRGTKTLSREEMMKIDKFYRRRKKPKEREGES